MGSAETFGILRLRLRMTLQTMLAPNAAIEAAAAFELLSCAQNDNG
jgi:hypothetical protein